MTVRLVICACAAVMITALAIVAARSELTEVSPVSPVIVDESKPALIASTRPARTPIEMVPRNLDPDLVRLQAGTSRPYKARPPTGAELSAVQLFSHLAFLYDGSATDFAWAGSGDIDTLRAIYDLWRPKVFGAMNAVTNAASPFHIERIEAGRCIPYPAASNTLSDLQKPQHPGQVCLVGSRWDASGAEIYQVSRFEPGEHPEIDAAQQALAQVRAELRAELEALRAGR